MKPKHHFLIVLICLGIFLFEWINFPEIRNHPYMVGLFIVVGLITYWNLLLTISKSLRKN